MSCYLRSVLSCVFLAMLSLGLAGCGGDEGGVGGAVGSKPVVEERQAGDQTPGLKEEGKLPADFRR